MRKSELSLHINHFEYQEKRTKQLTQLMTAGFKPLSLTQFLKFKKLLFIHGYLQQYIKNEGLQF